MLADERIDEFAERGFVLIPRVVEDDVLARAARRIDNVAAADPPPASKRGSHFYFLKTKDEPALMAPLTGQSRVRSRRRTDRGQDAGDPRGRSRSR